MSDTPKEPDKLTPATIFDRLLEYASTPWKAAVVIILLILGGIGYLIWTERAVIANAILKDPIVTPQLDIARFARDADGLIRDTRADAAILVELHLVDNVYIDRLGFDRNHQRFIPIEGPQPIVGPATSAVNLAKFLRNEVVCLDTENGVLEEVRALFAAGYMRACAVQVPPVIGVGVGALVVAWKAPLLPSAEQRAGLAMQSAAMKFATW